MPAETIALLLSDPDTGRLLESGILRPAGFQVNLIADGQAALELFKINPPDLLILDDFPPQEIHLADNSHSAEEPVSSKGAAGAEVLDCLDLAGEFLKQNPLLPILLLPRKHSEALEVKALRLGLLGYLAPPIRANEVLTAVRLGLQRQKRLKEWMKLEMRRSTDSLQTRLSGLEALQRIGRSVTAVLDLDSVLEGVVDAAVELTGAEEGSLLLLDENTGELYMRAARNFHDDFVRTFRLPIRDTLPGQVLRSGKPLVIDEKLPQKIKTAYLVHTLIYVPLQVQGRAIGVLGVDNRQSGHRFQEQHVTLISALGDYAAIAIANANLYSRTEIERKKLETILTKVEDGVIVVDHDGRILLVNHTARSVLSMSGESLLGRPARDIIQNSDLLDMLNQESSLQPSRSEITLEDGRIFNAQLTPIPEVGLAITMQDITHLKELDRIKSDFVSTVSHDLRSPLTAILGYVELIDRVGPINDQQREFVRRVQFSVNNITMLINDLLDLGRIEAGFDALKEIVSLSMLIRSTLDSFRNRLEEKGQAIRLDIPEKLPKILGNPTRLRQMLANLIGNAIKYTSAGGWVAVRATAEDGQIILQISDNGPGIPPSDQPYIFDKFYRASNVATETSGTGLGLAIVKSIVENHQGRIWVDSVLGQGTMFTVVLPVVDEGL